MKIKNKLNGIVILVFCLTLISLAILPCISLAAPTTYSVYFNGGTVANGGSVHYQGNSGITIGIKVPDATDFYVTFDGTTGDTSLTIDGSKLTKKIDIVLQNNGKILAKLQDYVIKQSDEFIFNPQKSLQTRLINTH